MEKGPAGMRQHVCLGLKWEVWVEEECGFRTDGRRKGKGKVKGRREGGARRRDIPSSAAKRATCMLSLRRGSVLCNTAAATARSMCPRGLWVTLINLNQYQTHGSTFGNVMTSNLRGPTYLCIPTTRPLLRRYRKVLKMLATARYHPGGDGEVSKITFHTHTTTPNASGVSR